MQIPIERFTLDNGLRVVFSEDHTNAVVAVNLWYNVGSRNEAAGRTGLTTLESMDAVAKLMRDRGLNRAVLVSDPFHMLRLKLLAIRVGIRGFTSPTPDSPISRNRAQERRFLIRESFGLPVAVLGMR